MNESSILIVDDNRSIVRMLELVLEHQGYRVLTAYDGFEALEKAVREKPDVILLDVIMPGIDGFEVCRRLNNSPVTSSIPVIFLTIKGQTDLPEIPEFEKEIVRNLQDRNQGYDIGAAGFLSKPVSAKEVIDEVRRVLLLYSLGTGE